MTAAVVRTTCRRGHELTPENIRKRTGKRANERECLTCHLARSDAWRAADPETAAARDRIRRRAIVVGLRVSKHGELFTLRPAGGGPAVFHGALGAVEKHLDGIYRPRKPGVPAAKVPAAWREILAAFVLFLEASGRSPGTVNAYLSIMSRLARELRCAPAEVTEDVLIGWFAGQRWKPETRRGHRAAVRVFYSWAHKTGRVPSNPADAVPATRVPPTVPRPVGDADWIAAIEAATPKVRLMIRLAGEAGLRRSEVAKVAARDVVDGPGGFPDLVVLGKGGRTRVVPISDDLAAAIRSNAGPSGFVFPGSCDGHLSPNYIGTLVARALPPGWSMHKLRHRYATRTFRFGGRNILATKALLGHSSVATTQRYTAVDPEEIRVAAMAAVLTP